MRSGAHLFSLGVFYHSAQSARTLCYRQDSGRTDARHVRYLELTCSSRVLTVDATVSAKTQELEYSWDRTLGKSLLALSDKVERVAELASERVAAYLGGRIFFVPCERAELLAGRFA